MVERTTVRLSDELLERAKRKARAEGRTLTALIEDGLRLIVSGESQPARRPGVKPRISVASGGLKPGLDLARISEIDEHDDLAVLELRRVGR